MFRVGQLVVCVRDDGFPNKETMRQRGAEFPVRGRIYTMRDLYASDRGGLLCCRLVEITNPTLSVLCGCYGAEPGFSVSRFRPVVDSRLDVFREMLVRPPTERVDA